jgi:hypothetical protein
MITTTVGGLLSTEIRMAIRAASEPIWLYVVRAEGTVLYVGRAVDPTVRLRNHLNPRWPRVSPLGEVILANAPESYDWTVELLTADDCRSLTAGQPDAFDLEVACIRLLRPCINTAHNPNRSPWPAGVAEAPHLPEYSPAERRRIADGVRW